MMSSTSGQGILDQDLDGRSATKMGSKSRPEIRTVSISSCSKLNPKQYIQTSEVACHRVSRFSVSQNEGQYVGWGTTFAFKCCGWLSGLAGIDMEATG